MRTLASICEAKLSPSEVPTSSLGFRENSAGTIVHFALPALGGGGVVGILNMGLAFRKCMVGQSG